MMKNMEELSQQTNRLMTLVVIFHLLIIAAGGAIQLIDARNMRINMPNVRPDHDEHYLCMAHRLSSHKEEYIVGFEPNASAEKVHHLLVYGCQWPGVLERDSPHYVWDCGEMHANEDLSKSSYKQGPICARGADTSILFGWALDATALNLPKGVGFKIGGQTHVNFIVLQVHYGHTKAFARNPTLTDNSGITLRTVPATDPTIDKQAGVLLLASYGVVPPGISKHEIYCTIEENKIINPFRFRIHTHKLGTLAGGYKMGIDGKQKFIGKGDPQEPQMFYPIQDKRLTLTGGDMVYAYCDYNNTRGVTVNIGSTNQDEMCNFYIMYWTYGPQALNQKICTQRNPTLLF